MLFFLTIASNLFFLASTFFLGFFSILKNPTSNIAQRWFNVCMAVCIWIIGYLLIMLSANEQEAYMYNKIVYAAAAFLPILSFHFIVSFLYKSSGLKNFIIAGYVIASIFSFLSIFTTWVIKDLVYVKDLSFYEEVEAPGFYFYLFYFFFYTLVSTYLLIKGYLGSRGFNKRQNLYLLIAALVGFFGGASNFLTEGSGIYPYGQLLVWLVPVFITYGIFIKKIKFEF